MMFAVHFLSPRVMIDPWLQDGVICPSNQLGETPRIVFVASKSHHSSHVVDFDRLGVFTDYWMKDSLNYYGISKLLLCMYATELSRRLNPDDMVEVAVHAMCPGGIASNIAKDAPVLLQPLVNPLLRHFLQSPEEGRDAGNLPVLCRGSRQQAAGSANEQVSPPDATEICPAGPHSDPGNGERIVGSQSKTGGEITATALSAAEPCPARLPSPSAISGAFAPASQWRNGSTCRAGMSS